jgi:hypothetical protein
MGCCWYIPVVSGGRQANEFIRDFHRFVVILSASLRARHQLLDFDSGFFARFSRS